MDTRRINCSRCFHKKGSKRDALEEIVRENKFRYTQSKDNLVVFEGVEFKVQNFMTKGKKEQE